MLNIIENYFLLIVTFILIYLISIYSTKRYFGCIIVFLSCKLLIRLYILMIFILSDCSILNSTSYSAQCIVTQSLILQDPVTLNLSSSCQLIIIFFASFSGQEYVYCDLINDYFKPQIIQQSLYLKIQMFIHFTVQIFIAIELLYSSSIDIKTQQPKYLTKTNKYTKQFYNYKDCQQRFICIFVENIQFSKKSDIIKSLLLNYFVNYRYNNICKIIQKLLINQQYHNNQLQIC
uniref:Transmembrane domain-containing protein n=1 Tax=Spironucleus salmonicida TaxID=348837 RepID=V6M2R9_9EUKA|eukprot:EST47559.1 Transmembrane domain-containing protein [Spironucleus salmonicida]